MPKDEAGTQTGMTAGTAPSPSRRTFLRAGLAAGGAALVGGNAVAAPGDPANLPPNVAGLVALSRRPAVRGAAPTAGPRNTRGNREFDATWKWLTAIARIVGELHAAARARRADHPQRPVASSATTAGNRRDRAARTNRLILHGLVDKELVFTLDDIKRMPRAKPRLLRPNARRTRAWSGAGRGQLNGCQFTHGMIHSVM